MSIDASQRLGARWGEMLVSPRLAVLWSELRVLALYFSAVHFAAMGFFVEALYSDLMVPVPPHLRLHAIAAHLVVTLMLYASDRVLERWAGERWVHAFRAGVLAACLLLVLRRLELHVAAVRFVFFFSEALHPGAALGVRVVTLVAAACVSVRFQRQVATGFVYLASVALVLTVVWSRGDLAPDPIYAAYDTSEVRRGDSDAAPTVVIVFDEFSYEALLDESGAINAERYPNFARLGRESMAFSNATTNYFHTWLVVPTMIDAAIGLTPSRDLVLYEQTARIDRLYAPGCGERYTCRGAGYLTEQRQARLSAHVAARGLHTAVPAIVYDELDPALSWLRRITGAAPTVADPIGFHVHTDAMLDEFLADLGRDRARGRVFLVHTMLPHSPYIFTRDGRTDRRERVDFSWSNPQEGEAAEEIVRAYGEQLAYADAAIGRIIDTLEQEGLWDEASLIVTADHGVRRDGPSEDGEAPEVDSRMPRVPLFIRAPGVPRGWTDVDYQHIDFGLTLEDITGVAIGSGAVRHIALEGAEPVSALDASRPAREKTFFIDAEEDARYWRFVQDGTGEWTLVDSVDREIGDRTDAYGDVDVH